MPGGRQPLPASLLSHQCFDDSPPNSGVRRCVNSLAAEHVNLYRPPSSNSAPPGFVQALLVAAFFLGSAGTGGEAGKHLWWRGAAGGAAVNMT